MTAKQHRADVFVPEAEDPRYQEPTNGGEKETLAEYLRFHRQTLELKCGGLTPEQLATRSVPPSTMSLLGLVRHMAEVERSWFRRVLAGEDAPKLYQTEDEPDGDFDGATGDAATVEEAFAAWRAEVAYAEAFVAAHDDLTVTGQHREHGAISLREVLVHMIEEYARHNGHADLLRECVDGRVGQ